MIIRQMQPKDCFAARRLWQAVFHDTEGFANFYFSHRFTPVLSFGAFEDGELVSMSLGRRFQMSNPSYRAVMISGVSTMPEYRHRGLMRETMTRLLENARLRGYDIAVLSPAIPHLYDPFEFAPLTYAVEVTETASDLPEDIMVCMGAENLYPIYQKAEKAHRCMMHRTKEDVELALNEYRRDHGITLITKDRNGYICFLPQVDGVEVTECLAGNAEDYQRLMKAAAFHSETQSATAWLPQDCGLPGTTVRPLYAVSLKEQIRLESLSNDPKSYCIEKY